MAKKERHSAVSQSLVFLPQAGFISQHSETAPTPAEIWSNAGTKQFHWMRKDQPKTKHRHYILTVKLEVSWPMGYQCKKIKAQSNMVNTVSSLLYLIFPAWTKPKGNSSHQKSPYILYWLTIESFFLHFCDFLHASHNQMYCHIVAPPTLFL